MSICTFFLLSKFFVGVVSSYPPFIVVVLHNVLSGFNDDERRGTPTTTKYPIRATIFIKSGPSTDAKFIGESAHDQMISTTTLWYRKNYSFYLDERSDECSEHHLAKDWTTDWIENEKTLKLQQSLNTLLSIVYGFMSLFLDYLPVNKYPKPKLCISCHRRDTPSV